MSVNRPPIPDPPHRGGCLCGAVRYSFNARPLAVNACHCRDCQHFTGATNLISVYAPRESFVHEKGKVDHYRKRADSGNESDYFRCANCGCRLWHEPHVTPQWTLVAAGTLDDTSWVVPTTHIWTSRAMPAAVIPEGVPSWEKAVDRMELLAAFEKAYAATQDERQLKGLVAKQRKPVSVEDMKAAVRRARGRK